MGHHKTKLFLTAVFVIVLCSISVHATIQPYSMCHSIDISEINTLNYRSDKVHNKSAANYNHIKGTAGIYEWYNIGVYVSQNREINLNKNNLPNCYITDMPDCLCCTDAEVTEIDFNNEDYLTFDYLHCHSGEKSVWRTKRLLYDEYANNPEESNHFKCIEKLHGGMINLNSTGYDAIADSRYTDILLC